MTDTHRVVVLVALVGVLFATGVVGTVAGQLSGADNIGVEGEDIVSTADSTVGQDGEATDLTGRDGVTVEVGAGDQGFKFDPADIVVDEGTTVRWVWTGRGGQHTIFESESESLLDNPSFESELNASNDHEFTHTFEDSGTHDYVCSVHIAQDMVGSVEVVEGDGDEGDDGTLTKEFDVTFGGPDIDRMYSVIQTSDGGYALAGDTDSFSSTPNLSDAWLIKTDQEGNKEFDSTFGGESRDTARSIAQTSDGGYVLSGGTRSYSSGTQDFWLIKTDENGNEEFNKTFEDDGIDRAESIVQTQDGGYALAGRKGPAEPKAGWLIKTDSNGNEEFNKTFGGAGGDYFSTVIQTPDGGYALGGYTRSFGLEKSRTWLIKTDENGNKEFREIFRENNMSALSLDQTSDGGYVLAGGESMDTPVLRFYTGLIKTDENGEEEFSKIFDDLYNSVALSVVQTSDGGYVLGGRAKSSDSEKNDAWLLKTDEGGDEEFNRTFGGMERDIARSVIQTSDGGYALGAQTRSFSPNSDDIWLIKIASEDGPSDSLSPNNPFGDSSNNPVDRITVISRVVQWNLNGEINGTSFTRSEIINFVVEWNLAS